MSVRQIEEGFIKAFSNDMPTVTDEMAARFVKFSGLYTSSEMRGVKAARSSDSHYADDAMGYVMLKREGNICTVKGRITPEHKVRQKGYVVVAKIDENENKVIDVKCQDCAASEGGCKHAVAFLFWLHRRGADKTGTEKKCYWKKSTLSKVGTDIQCMEITAIAKTPQPAASVDGVATNINFLDLVKDHVKHNNLSVHMSVLNHMRPASSRSSIQVDLSLDDYLADCKANQREPDATGFLDHLRQIDSSDWNDMPKITLGQSSNPLWFRYRFGRITGSKCYDAAQCKTMEGSLREAVLCSRKFKGNAATRRGLELEPQVLKTLEKARKVTINSDAGLFLDKNRPIFGSSPDGVTNDGSTVVEVKCPSSIATVASYIKDGKITPKFRVQLQMEMLFCKAQKGLFVVADPGYENNQQLQIIEDKFDYNFLEPFLVRAKAFWVESVFPELLAHRV